MPEHSERAQQCYGDLMRNLFSHNSPFYRTDVHLRGFQAEKTWHPRVIPDDDVEAVKAQNTVLRSLIEFPKDRFYLFEEQLFNKPYSLLTLVALSGSPVLVYYLLHHGVDMRSFDWSRLASCPRAVSTVLRSGLIAQRVHETLSYSDEIAQKILHLEQRESSVVTTQSCSPFIAQIKKRSASPTESPTKLVKKQRSSPSGTIINGYFVEDYEEEVAEETVKDEKSNLCGGFAGDDQLKSCSGLASDDQPKRWGGSADEVKCSPWGRPSVDVKSKPENGVPAENRGLRAIPTTEPILRAGTCSQSSLKAKQARLARLNLKTSLESVIKEEPKTKPDDWPGNDNKPKPSSLVHPASGPPYRLKISNIPIEASVESIKIFLEVGSDAFKAARKLNHRTDALSRSVHKYRPGSNGVKAKFPRITERVGELIFNKDKKGEFQSVCIDYPTLEEASQAFQEFKGKKYLYHDLLSPGLECQFESGA